MRLFVQFRIILIVRVMFGNFAKIGRAAGASPIWQNFQTSRVTSPNVNATYREIVCGPGIISTQQRITGLN